MFEVFIYLKNAFDTVNTFTKAKTIWNKRSMFIMVQKLSVKPKSMHPLLHL